MFTKKTKIFLLLIAMLSAIAFTACGGGSGGGSSDSGSGDGGGGGGGGGATTVNDIDGNVYNTVTIGTQVWMKENLKTTRYRNGDAIPTTTNDFSGETSPKYQWAYNNDENNVPVYGRLYTWYAATDSRGLCPTGWRVPTDADWTVLTTFLGGDAGGKMKEAGTAHWTTPNTVATNSSGFTALPGGYHLFSGEFSYLGYYGFWWSATENAASALTRHLIYNYAGVNRNYHEKNQNGFSVRCIKGSDVVVIEVTDIDNNVYNTVTIGTQVWMKENLKTTRYRNGEAIPTTTSIIPNDPTSKYQWAYDNDENNVPVYGRLYTWYAATDSRGLCPTGWHVPTDAEWTVLTTFLGGDAGGKMKEAGTAHWTTPNTGATNSSGFTALPGGYRFFEDSIYGTFFLEIGYEGRWWSASTQSQLLAWSIFMGNDYTYVVRNFDYKEFGLSVRCVRD